MSSQADKTEMSPSNRSSVAMQKGANEQQIIQQPLLESGTFEGCNLKFKQKVFLRRKY